MTEMGSITLNGSGRSFDGDIPHSMDLFICRTHVHCPDGVIGMTYDCCTVTNSGDELAEFDGSVTDVEGNSRIVSRDGGRAVGPCFNGDFSGWTPPFALCLIRFIPGGFDCCISHAIIVLAGSS